MRIHNLLAAVSMLAMAAPAWADWRKIGEDEMVATYIDVASIVKKGKTRTVLMLIDVRNGHSSGPRSALYLTEYDCDKKRSRPISETTFANAMGQGELLSKYDGAGEWVQDMPNSIGATILETVCAK